MWGVHYWHVDADYFNPLIVPCKCVGMWNFLFIILIGAMVLYCIVLYLLIIVLICSFVICVSVALQCSTSLFCYFNYGNILSQHLKFKTKLGIKCIVADKIIESTTYTNTHLFHAGTHILPFCILYFFLCLLTGVEVNWYIPKEIRRRNAV